MLHKTPSSPSHTHRQRRSRTLSKWALIFTIALSIFLFDSFTNFEIATPVLYVSVVLIGAQFLSSKGLWCIALICIGMTIISLIITPHGDFHSGLINTFLSIVAISSTTFMATRMLHALAAEHETRLQLIHFARINALGELSASITHEIKQPLTGMTSSARAAVNWLSLENPNIERAISALHRVSSDASRMTEIINRIQNMSRRSSPIFKETSITLLLQDTLDIIHKDLNQNHIALFLKNDCKEILLTLDEVQIQQVFLNILINAISAIKASHRKNGRITIAITKKNNAALSFTISDNGIGIDKKDIPYIFEPFHTTRKTGTGLGLAICRSIIEAHGGTIAVACSAETGTSFRFLLPLSQ